MLHTKQIGSNGHSQLPPLVVEYVPAALRKEIEQIFEEEGLMTESAERRILTAIDTNHKELQGAIGNLKDTIHGHDKRLTLVEEDVKDMKDGQRTAADERRNTSRIIKAAFITSIVGILVGVFASLYGPRATPPAVQEAVKQDAALTEQLKEFIQVIKEEREERKAQEAIPTATPPRGGTRGTTKMPMPRGKSQAYPDGAHIVDDTLLKLSSFPGDAFPRRDPDELVQWP